MESTETFSQVLAEGRKLLEAGDKTRALPHLVMATQLNPRDADAWLLRAEATTEPGQAAACLEQALAIDPDNAQARENLLFLRVSTLQSETKVKSDAAERRFRSSLRGRLVMTRLQAGVILAIFVFCGIVGLGVAALALLPPPSLGESAGKPAQAPALAALELPATWTPVPTPRPTARPSATATATPAWRTTTDLNIRAGPSTSHKSLGVLPRGSVVNAVARSPDGKFLGIHYPDASTMAWVSGDYVDITKPDLAALPTLSAYPTAAPQKVAVKPTYTPTLRADFALGRPVELSANCSKSWKVMGTVYAAQQDPQRLNGILIRIWSFGQMQGTLTTGAISHNMPGYWEWTFARASDVDGQAAVVNADGTLRSQPVSFQLTGRCDGDGAVNQVVLDFVGVR